MNTLAPALAALISFPAALLIDRTMQAIRLRAADTGLIGPTLWGAVALELLFVAILLATSWLVAVHLKPPRWLAIVLITIALIVIAAYPLAVAGIPYLSQLFSRGIFTAAVFEGAPGTLLSIQACAILLSAICSFFRPPRMHAA
jgi:hypothetical protein